MNRWRTPTEVAESISFPFMTGRTNTGAALRQMRENMYLPQNGARRDARYKLIKVHSQWAMVSRKERT